ncbi:MAG: hypothetical protein AAGA77_03890 [Bacteroidota bacterium]
MENWHEHIEDYMEGTLAGDLKEAFEKELEYNKSLKAAVENYEDARKISEGLLEIDMMETLSRLSESNNDERNKKFHNSSDSKLKGRIINLRKWVAAASVVGTLLVGVWWINESIKEVKFKNYVLNNIERPIDENTTRSIDIEDESPLEKGKYYYWLNDFEESINWLKIALEAKKDKKSQSEGHFWLGHAYVQLWMLEEAQEAWMKSEEEGVKEVLRLISEEE